MIKDKDCHRYCQVCGKIIDNLHFNCKTCSLECGLIYNNLDKKNKICRGCGNLFYGTRHQIYCEDCRSKPDFKLNIYRNSITYKEQIIVCQGWMGAVIPLYVKTAYHDEPSFANGLGLNVRVSDSLCPSCSKKI
jgi:predicted nucleic acid-binding Zn ribbon protein